MQPSRSRSGYYKQSRQLTERCHGCGRPGFTSVMPLVRLLDQHVRVCDTCHEVLRTSYLDDCKNSGQFVLELARCYLERGCHLLNHPVAARSVYGASQHASYYARYPKLDPDHPTLQDIFVRTWRGYDIKTGFISVSEGQSYDTGT